MTEERKKTLNVGRKIGAAMGAIVFAVFGIVPGFYFGSAGTLILLSHLAGGSVEPGIIVRMLLVVGSMLGVFCVGAVSIVVGAVIGTALAYLTDLVRMPAKTVEKAVTVQNN